jgi:hypothetical protein
VTIGAPVRDAISAGPTAVLLGRPKNGTKIP